MELSGADAAYLTAGLALLAAIVLPTLTRRVPISSPLVLLVIGVAIGASTLADPIPLDLQEHRSVVEHVTELTVLVALMGVGLAIDRPLRLRSLASWRAWSPTWRLLAIAMPLSIAGVVALGLAAGLPLAVALLLGASLAPTDPVLASDVQVGGPTVADPESDETTEEHSEERSEVRFALTSEAGLNDGLAFPFVYAAILLAAGGSLWSGVATWVGFYLILKVVIGVVVGVAVGALLARLAFRSRAESMRLAERGDPLFALAALLTAYGVAELLQGYGFLAVFACAMAVRAAERGSSYHRGLHELTERLELLLTLLGLLFLGIALGRGLLGSLTWWGALIGVALVFVIRPLAGWLSLSIAPRDHDKPGGLTPAERWVVAFFGVRGVGSVFYLTYGAAEIHDIPAWVWATIAFTIVLSVTVHGVLATPVMRRVEESPA